MQNAGVGAPAFLFAESLAPRSGPVFTGILTTIWGFGMFGRRTPTDFDGENLARLADTVATREDFSRFAQLLSQNFRKRRPEWENDKLDKYLEALAAFSSSFDGYKQNTGSTADENPWRLLATVLLAAKVYE